MPSKSNSKLTPEPVWKRLFIVETESKEDEPCFCEFLEGEREAEEREWTDFCLVAVIARASSAWRSTCGECGGSIPRERPSDTTDDEAGPYYSRKYDITVNSKWW